jgi:hypothetical protein
MAASNGRLICFGSVHPDADDAQEEIHRIKELGLYGSNCILITRISTWRAPTRLRCTKPAAKSGLPVAFHMGYDPVQRGPCAPRPERFRADLRHAGFNGDRRAHGRRRMHGRGRGLPCGKPVYLDTSMSANPPYRKRRRTKRCFSPTIRRSSFSGATRPGVRRRKNGNTSNRWDCRRTGCKNSVQERGRLFGLKPQ